MGGIVENPLRILVQSWQPYTTKSAKLSAEPLLAAKIWALDHDASFEDWGSWKHHKITRSFAVQQQRLEMPCYICVECEEFVTYWAIGMQS